MKKITEKSRKLLRKLYLVFGAGAVSLLFAACYGMPMDDNYIEGQVRCKETGDPISGIKVTAGVNSVDNFTHTNHNGVFHIFVDYGYTIIFEDIDGDENGGLFKTKTITFDSRSTYLDIYLEKEE